jgi:hypothetical protein
MDAREKELLCVGAAGVIGACFCLYALVFPAFAVLYLTDGYHFQDLASQMVVGVFIVALTAAIAGGLVVSVAAIRMATIGAWPGRRFVLGLPAAVIGAVAFALTAVLAFLL